MLIHMDIAYPSMPIMFFVVSGIWKTNPRPWNAAGFPHRYVNLVTNNVVHTKNRQNLVIIGSLNKYYANLAPVLAVQVGECQHIA